MPTVEKVSGARVYVRDIGRFEVGDRKEVSESEAEYLVEERGDFVYVDEGEADEASDPDGDSADTSDETADESAGEAADEAEDNAAGEEADDEPADESAAADATADDEPGAAAGDDFEVNGWLDNDYRDRAEAVLEGGLDDYLDEIAEAETSQTVLDAVAERRAALEG